MQKNRRTAGPVPKKPHPAVPGKVYWPGHPAGDLAGSALAQSGTATTGPPAFASTRVTDGVRAGTARCTAVGAARGEDMEYEPAVPIGLRRP